jgi:hypothetical protein
MTFSNQNDYETLKAEHILIIENSTVTLIIE